MTLNQVLSAWSLRLISATFYSVVTNMSPGHRLLPRRRLQERELHLCGTTGQAKVWGVATSVAGATVMVAWSGPVVLSSPSTESGSQALGFAMSVCAIFSSSLWTLLVERVAKKFPADVTLAALMSFFGTIQTATFAAITEPLYSWKIRWTGSLMPFVILYGGCIMPLLAFYALIWCIHKKGPVFAAAFSPLQIVFSFLIETLILGKQAHLGRLVFKCHILCSCSIA
ncbi:WAT1-related protein [Acorus calamus]|uniref:WAT1-related protein n=1 Tax=Acorus calamus TaxID=4465 RepID=A0AAV9CXH5_ACOCL|nr:WAT1-related protein [Acorus calamus]